MRKVESVKTHTEKDVRAYTEKDVKTYTYTAERLAELLPFPPKDANKYSRGKVVLVVGSVSYPGAACLAACAAERMGAGYTEVITAAAILDLLQASNYALVVRARESMTARDFAAICNKKQVACVVGSGFDADNHDLHEWVYTVLEQTKAPVLVDGGGLLALSADKGKNLLQQRFVNGYPTLITPHMGEAARIAQALSLSAQNPIELSCALARMLSVVVVLKGPDTFISDGREVVCMSQGSPALAKAGTGDVLAGMIGALLAQGISPFDAGVLGTTLHAKAGCCAEMRLTSICVGAQDVIASLPEAVISLMQDASQKDK